MNREAVATMQDALRMIRYSFPIANIGEGIDFNMPASFYDAALQAAWKRTSMTQAPEDESSMGRSIFIVTDHDNPSSVYSKLHRASNALCVIKIDPLEGLTECDDRMDRSEIESSIMLYNYSIACICFADGQVENVDETRQNSLTIMKLAQFGTTKLLNDSLSYPRHPLDIPSCLLLVTMLLLDTLCHWCAGTEISECPIPIHPITKDLNLILTIVAEREMVLSQEGIGLTLTSPAA